MSQPERRKSPRFSVNVPVRVTSGDDTFGGILKDLCRDAALVESQRVAALGSEVVLALALPGTGGPLQVAGRVVRLGEGDHGGHDMAVLFTNLSSAAETRIDFFITLQQGG
jgi:hypothetical protein